MGRYGTSLNVWIENILLTSYVCVHLTRVANIHANKISDEKPEDLGISQIIFLFEENH